jgi:predicted DNA binding CopG/RHH family protein
MKKKLDLSRLGKNSQQFLVKQDHDFAAKETDNQRLKKRAAEKKGRPMKFHELLDQKVTINLTQSELLNLRGRAGQIPLTTFVRDILKRSSVI